MPLPPGFHDFWLEIVCHLNVFPTGKVSFLSHYFLEFFFFPLDFRSWTISSPGEDFSWFILFGVRYLYWIVSLCYLLNLQSFQPLFFKHISSPHLLALSSQDSDSRTLGPSAGIPRVLSVSTKYLLLCCFKFSPLPSALLLMLSPSTEFLILVIVIFSSKISIWFFLYLSIRLCWDFLFPFFLSLLIIYIYF